MKVLRFGWGWPQLSARLGYDPDVVVEVEDPVDRAAEANGGAAFVPDLLEAVSLVQSAAAFSDAVGSPPTVTATFGVTPTEDNLLIAVLVQRSTTATATTPSGWTLIDREISTSFDGGYVSMWRKTAGASEPTAVSIETNTANDRRLVIMEYSGISASDTSVGLSSQSASTSLVAGPISPASGPGGLLVAAYVQAARAASPVSSGNSFTEVDEYQVSSSGPASYVQYRAVAPMTGSYSGAATSSESDGYGSIIASFSGGGLIWRLGPKTIDADDATYNEVEATGETEIWRATLDAAYFIATANLRIGVTSAGARTLVLQGANEADFGDAVTVGSFIYTATGSLTADDVAVSWTPTELYQFWRITDATDEIRRIYSVELYELTNDLSGYQLRSEKGVASGYAELDSSGLVPVAQIPTLDHGSKLSGLGDDDHTQYLLRSVLTTRGDIFRRGASAIERLPLGTDGQVLTSDGTDAVWDDASGGGGGGGGSGNYATTVGNGSDTTIVVTHSLNTRNVIVMVYRTASPYDQVFPLVEMDDADNVSLTFASAPSSGEYTVVIAVGGGYPSGTSFPGSPSSGDRFDRTDLNRLCFYDGTRWLTMTEFTLPLTARTLMGFTASPSTWAHAPVDSEYDMFITRIEWTSFVSTTNDGSNYWTHDLQKVQTSSGTSIVTDVTSAQAANAWVRQGSAAVDHSVVKATYNSFTLVSTKTGSPGACYVAATVKYRLVIT